MDRTKTASQGQAFESSHNNFGMKFTPTGICTTQLKFNLFLCLLAGQAGLPTTPKSHSISTAKETKEYDLRRNLFFFLLLLVSLSHM